MKFRTEIEISKSELNISHHSKVLMMGSCFTNSIGQKMIESKFDVNLNPFGTLYNPTSIRKGVEQLLENKIYTAEDLFIDKGIYNSFYHHSIFSSIEEEECLSNINVALINASKKMKETDILFITFGTAYVYEYLETNEIVGNCHKLPSKDFKRYRLTTDTIVKEWSDLIQKLQVVNPKLQIIFTVSPIRHLRDGAHDNQLSKATLLLAAEQLNSQFANTHYFPSYEIVLDDLRDYRFYSEDLIHPSNLAIEYIWKVFKDVYIAEATNAIVTEWNKIKQAIDHRPFNQESTEHIHFLKQTLLKLNKFGAKHPYICLDREKKSLEDKINK